MLEQRTWIKEDCSIAFIESVAEMYAEHTSVHDIVKSFCQQMALLDESSAVIDSTSMIVARIYSLSAAVGEIGPEDLPSLFRSFSNSR